MEAKDQAHGSDEEDYKDENFIEKPAILDKYKAAALITNAALVKVISLCVVGADISAVCGQGDKFMEEELRKVYNNKKTKKMERGIAFPCCISVNNIMGHYSPMADESSLIAEGDIAKIDMGCHLDGFVAQAAHTVYVSANPAERATGKKADAVLAAYHAMQAAQRLFKEMTTNTEITQVIAKVCAEYETNPLEGVLSHKMKKHLIDGNDVIINIETPEQKVEEFELAAGDVIGLDIFVSTGEGKPKEGDYRTTVYKRELDTQYNLKIKSARAFFSEVNKKYPTLPFSIRAFEESTAAKIGVKECVNHDLI
jgi:curved DNA binding protein